MNKIINILANKLLTVIWKDKLGLALQLGQTLVQRLSDYVVTD